MTKTDKKFLRDFRLAEKLLKKAEKKGAVWLEEAYEKRPRNVQKCIDALLYMQYLAETGGSDGPSDFMANAANDIVDAEVVEDDLEKVKVEVDRSPYGTLITIMVRD